MKIHFSKSNIQIEDSYEIKSKSEMKELLRDIREAESCEVCLPLLRSDESLLNEWASHNLCYNL